MNRKEREHRAHQCSLYEPPAFDIGMAQDWLESADKAAHDARIVHECLAKAQAYLSEAKRSLAGVTGYGYWRES